MFSIKFLITKFNYCSSIQTTLLQSFCWKDCGVFVFRLDLNSYEGGYFIITNIRHISNGDNKSAPLFTRR